MGSVQPADLTRVDIKTRRLNNPVLVTPDQP